MCILPGFLFVLLPLLQNKIKEKKKKNESKKKIEKKKKLNPYMYIDSYMMANNKQRWLPDDKQNALAFSLKMIIFFLLSCFLGFLKYFIVGW